MFLYIATVGFSLECANVVGYDTKALQGGFTAAGASFVNVSDGSIKLGDLKVTGYGDEDAGVTVQTLDAYGRTIETYTWYDVPGDFVGWLDSSDNYVEDMTIAPIAIHSCHQASLFP